MRTLVIVIATCYIVYSVLLSFGVFEFIDRPKRTVQEVEAKRKLTKKRKLESSYLGLCTAVVNMFRGIFMSDSSYENHEYYIQRLELKTKYLGRLYTPEEICGQRALPLILSFITIPIALFRPVVLIVPAAAFVVFATYQTSYKMQISDEDEIIDNYFIDLYLLLYSKLKQGSRARLQGSVENYISTLETSSKTVESKVMLKFAKYFLNLLALYEDHVAVPKLRDNYHSATIINFCNVATQALNGIDNADNLLTFKMQLTERKTNLMRMRQQQILKKGERSIYAIWVILFIFVAVGWYSKLPTGFF